MGSLIPSSLKRLFSNIPSFSKTGKNALIYLNITQFLGVINDNVFKFVMAFLLIDALGHSEASSILSATGAIYVIPFLLFSSSAGILADRFSKQKLLVLMKVAEMGVMLLAIFAFGAKTPWACFTLLFVLSTHSAMFGPSKYGIIPELVPPDKVSRANGLITSFTYLAIILGTFLASFLTEITNRHFVLIALFCFVVALGGFFSALAVKPTPAQGSQKKINLLFIRDIFITLKDSRRIRHLLPAISGSSYFLFIGAFTQLNIIPFALQSLNFSEVAGGYLFLATALGIALGSYLAGKASRKRVELGLPCLAGIGMSFFFGLIAIFPSNLFNVILCLVAIGILGGAFIVPFDTFIQLSSADEKRGQTIAATNFLSFTGVLIASFCLYLFNQVCGLSAAESFAVVGGITLLATLIFTLLLSDMALPYFSKKIFRHLVGFKTPHGEAMGTAQNKILILEPATWKEALLLAGTMPNIHFLIPSGSKLWRKSHSLFSSIHLVASQDHIDQVVETARAYTDQGLIPCLLLEKPLPKKTPSAMKAFLDFFHRSSIAVFHVRPSKDPVTGKPTFSFEKG
jgi:acyl-[acyl-carrier-protein]-phospholipid O-acyltransferase / long-chain-fatty-acid--[acyl-carrier-protein] ligase